MCFNVSAIWNINFITFLFKCMFVTKRSKMALKRPLIHLTRTMHFEKYWYYYNFLSETQFQSNKQWKQKNKFIMIRSCRKCLTCSQFHFNYLLRIFKTHQFYNMKTKLPNIYRSKSQCEQCALNLPRKICSNKKQNGKRKIM